MRQTHTYAILEISAAAYNEIRAKLVEAGYQHAFNEDDRREVIDMHGIAVTAHKASEPEPEVFFFGAIGQPGHYLKSKRTKIDFKDIPWREHIDTGLLKANTKRHAVSRAFQQTQGWTIISFDDFTGDSRGGSNSAFFCHAELTFEHLCALAKKQWPELAAKIPKDPVESWLVLGPDEAIPKNP